MNQCLLHTLEQVDNAIYQNEHLQRSYYGGYVSSELKDVYIKRGYFIIILVIAQNKSSVGHFIVVSKTQSGKLILFDSLAINPIKYGLNEFIHNNVENVYCYSNIKAQSEKSNCCAYFSLFYACKTFLNGMDFKSFLRIFENNNCEQNERLVYNYVKKMFCFE